MVLMNGHDLTVYYTAESSYGVVDDDSTWSPLLEAQNASGHGFSQEVKDVRRIGKRTRVGSPAGKIDNPDLVFEVALTTDALDAYPVFIAGLFDSTYDDSTPSYGFVFGNLPAITGGTYFEYYYGCVLADVEFKLSEGEIIMLTLTFSVQISVFSATELHVSISATYTAYPATITYALWSDITAFAKSGSFTNDTDLFAGASVSEITITVTQDVEKLYRLAGIQYPSKINMSGFEVTGSFTVDHENFVHVAEQVAKTGGTLTLTVSTVGTIALTNATFDEVTWDVDPNSLITLDIPFTANDVVFS